jgi:hypothetical protein
VQPETEGRYFSGACQCQALLHNAACGVGATYLQAMPVYCIDGNKHPNYVESHARQAEKGKKKFKKFMSSVFCRI